MLPTGELQLIVNLRENSLRFANGAGPGVSVCSGTLIQGMQSGTVVLDRLDQRDVAGVVLEPGAGRVLLGTPLDAWTDTHAELESSLIGDDMPLRELLAGAGFGAPLFDRWERWLVARVRRDVDRVVLATLQRMRHGQHGVRSLASDAGLSERALRRRFRAEVGLAPKQMARVLRFQRALVGLRGSHSIADVALSCGYHDQAHLTHEFRALAELTPSDYRRRGPKHRNHVA